MRKITDPKKRKDIRLIVRVTQPQYELIKKNASEMGLSEAEYIRKLLERKPMMKITIRHDLNDLRTELHYASNNLNQVAYALNGRYYHFPEDAQKVEQAVKEIREAVKKIIGAFETE